MQLVFLAIKTTLLTWRKYPALPFGKTRYFPSSKILISPFGRVRNSSRDFGLLKGHLISKSFVPSRILSGLAANQGWSGCTTSPLLCTSCPLLSRSVMMTLTSFFGVHVLIKKLLGVCGVSFGDSFHCACSETQSPSVMPNLWPTLGLCVHFQCGYLIGGQSNVWLVKHWTLPTCQMCAMISMVLNL